MNVFYGEGLKKKTTRWEGLIPIFVITEKLEEFFDWFEENILSISLDLVTPLGSGILCYIREEDLPLLILAWA